MMARGNLHILLMMCRGTPSESALVHKLVLLTLTHSVHDGSGLRQDSDFIVEEYCTR